MKVCSCLSLGLPMCSTFLLNGAGSMTYAAHLPGGVYKPTYGCSQTDHGSFMTGSWFLCLNLLCSTFYQVWRPISLPKHQEGGHRTDTAFLHHLCHCKWRGSKGASSKAFALCLQVLLTRLGGCLPAID